MWTRDDGLDHVRRMLGSARRASRLTVMQRLLPWARQDAAGRALALPIFRAAVDTEPDPATAVFAARALASFLGQVEGREGWFTLLARPDAGEMAALAGVEDAPSSVPALLALLDGRPELPVRVAAARALGRSRDRTAVLPALLRCLDDAGGLRSHAIEALADLGDPAAIPALEALLRDAPGAPPADPHGPAPRVAGLAAAAICRLREGAEEARFSLVDSAAGGVET